jgi:hypothetical protein
LETTTKTWQQIQEDAKVRAKITVIATTLLALGLQAGFIKILNPSMGERIIEATGHGWINDAWEIARLFLTTAPLSLGLTIVFTQLFIRRLKAPTESFGIVTVAAPILLFLCGLVGSQIGFAEFPPHEVVGPDSWYALFRLHLLINALASYYYGYGPSLFLSSVLISVFLGWTWAEVERHNEELRLAAINAAYPRAGATVAAPVSDRALQGETPSAK